MLTPSVGTTVTTSATTGLAGSPDALGRNEFMRLLVAKLENQDPLQPAKDTEFVAELATFSSLEQLIQVNQQLESLGRAQLEVINAQSFSLIGKEALVEAGGEVRVRDGRPDGLLYAVPKTAQEARLELLDASGEVVHTFQLDTEAGGPTELDFDGVSLEDGTYTLRPVVTDLEGAPMQIVLFRSLHIDAVSFVSGTAMSLVSGDLEIPFTSILEVREAA